MESRNRTNQEDVTVAFYQLPETFNLVLLIWYSVILSVGLAGNILTIIAILVCKKHRKTQNVYICSLAFADLIVCINAAPYTVWMLVQHNQKDHHLLFSFMCQSTGWLTTAMLCNTLYNLAGIAINRYICIIKPSHIYMRLYTRRRVGLSVFLIWLLSGLVVMPGMLGFGSFGYNDHFGSCLVTDDPLTYLMAMTILLIFCTLPCLSSIFFSYARILIHFRQVSHRARCRNTTIAHIGSTNDSSDLTQVSNLKPNPASSRGHREMAVIANLCVVFGVFLIFWMPLLSIYIFDYRRLAPVWVYRVFFAFATSNSCVNVFIYAGMNPAFRQTYIFILTLKWREINKPVVWPTASFGASSM